MARLSNHTRTYARMLDIRETVAGWIKYPSDRVLGAYGSLRPPCSHTRPSTSRAAATPAGTNPITSDLNVSHSDPLKSKIMTSMDRHANLFQPFMAPVIPQEPHFAVKDRVRLITSIGIPAFRRWPHNRICRQALPIRDAILGPRGAFCAWLISLNPIKTSKTNRRP